MVAALERGTGDQEARGEEEEEEEGGGGHRRGAFVIRKYRFGHEGLYL